MLEVHNKKLLVGFIQNFFALLCLSIMLIYLTIYYLIVYPSVICKRNEILLSTQQEGSGNLEQMLLSVHFLLADFPNPSTPFLQIQFLLKCVQVFSHSVVSNSLRPHGLAHQAPLSVGFCKQEYWSGQPFPSPGNLPDTGMEPRPPTLQADSLPSEPPGKPSSFYTWCLLGWP